MTNGTDAPDRPAAAVDFDAADLDVLLAEDEEDTADSTATLLGWAGHRVRVARNGPAALAAATERPPDVVILDVDLPGASGLAVAAALRRRVGGRRPLLVAVSGYGRDEDRRRSAEAGIDLHLVKPVPPAVLVGVLRRFRVATAAGC